MKKYVYIVTMSSPDNTMILSIHSTFDEAKKIYWKIRMADHHNFCREMPEKGDNTVLTLWTSWRSDSVGIQTSDLLEITRHEVDEEKPQILKDVEKAVKSSYYKKEQRLS